MNSFHFTLGSQPGPAPRSSLASDDLLGYNVVTHDLSPALALALVCVCGYLVHVCVSLHGGTLYRCMHHRGFLLSLSPPKKWEESICIFKFLSLCVVVPSVQDSKMGSGRFHGRIFNSFF